jgi:Carbohydrate binding module (family 6)
VLRNAFAGGSAKQYPTGNDFPTLAAWLADFVNRAAGDYRLKTTSLSLNAGSDGKNLGVDFAALNAALTASTAPPPSTPTPTPTSSRSSPYTGTAVALPGTVQLENYDAGGSDVADHDTTSGNSGGVYRSNNVDIQATTDSGGGYNIGWVKASEWLKYSVTIGAAGTYTLDVRVSSSGAGGTFHVEVDGVNATGSMTVPNTGGWPVWKTITKTGVALSAGPHLIRVVMDTNGPGGSVGNFNWFAVR